MYVTWTTLEGGTPAKAAPWSPQGAVFTQPGHAGRGIVEMPDFAGRWWSVLAVWDDEASARAAAPPPEAAFRAWHVVMEPVSFRGDAVLSGGGRPFDGLPQRGKVTGAAAVLTLAGIGPDPARTGEFLDRFPQLGRDAEAAPGFCAALVQAPTDGAILTFSAWRSLRDAVTWAYHRPKHAETVRSQEERPLLAQSGFLRCAVLSSSGTLRGSDPLAGLSGTPVHAQETS